MSLFFLWLSIHVAACVASGIVTGPRSAYQIQSLKSEHVAAILLWYTIPFSWLASPAVPSLAMFWGGFALYTSGAGLKVWAMLVNPYLTPEITKPKAVITSGPYQWLHHPLYVACSMQAFGTWAMLGSSRAAFFPLITYCLFLLVRADEESQLISQ